MKKMGMIFLISIFTIFSFSACSKETVDTSKLNIVTSFYPMYIATLNVVDGVDDVELKNLTAVTTGCLHDYQLTTSNMITLSTADILVVNGSGMESFVDKAVETCENLNIIDASEGIEILSDNQEEDEHHDHILEEHHDEHDEHKEEKNGHHHHHHTNAHIWVSISYYMQEVENIKNKLVEIDPKNAEKYIQNTNRYLEELKLLKEDMHNVLDKKENKKIVTFHQAFEYFAKEFNLDIVAVIEREPGTYPSARDVAEIIDMVREKDVKAVFTEPQYSKNAANTIARETGVSVYSLDPVVSGPLEKDAYQKIMRENLEIFEEAL